MGLGDTIEVEEALGISPRPRPVGGYGITQAGNYVGEWPFYVDRRGLWKDLGGRGAEHVAACVSEEAAQAALRLLEGRC